MLKSTLAFAMVIALGGCAAPDGPQGADGLPGPNGPDGKNGVNGANGEAGASGVPGATGAAGEAGAPGAKGDPGNSVGFPAGVIIAFGGAAASVPAGWVLCDGHTESRATEATLFAVIGTLNGGGDGTTTFNVPDLRGRFPRGLDTSGASRDPDVAARTGAPNGGATGMQVGSLEGTATKFPNNPFVTATAGAHTHTPINSTTGNVGVWDFTGPAAPGNLGGGGQNFINLALSTDGAHTHTISGGDSESRPANVAVNYIIKL